MPSLGERVVAVRDLAPDVSPPHGSEQARLDSDSVRFLILNTDYGEFLAELYDRNPGLEDASYDEQLAARNRSLFGVADFYSANLRRLGHEAEDVHVNNGDMQAAWAREHGVEVARGARAPLVRRAARRLGLGTATAPRGADEIILAERVARARPDVLLVQDMGNLDPRFLRSLRPHVGLVVGQHAAPALPHADSLRVYDLVLSSLPEIVESVRRSGVDAALHRLAFEPRVLDEVPEAPRTRDLTFVGNLFPGVHDARIALLERLADVFGERLEIYAPTPPQSPRLRSLHRGSAWGREMYRVLRESKVTINDHAGFAAAANNCRLYEATGMGAALVTDAKPNLDELFEPSRELLAFACPAECIDEVSALLADDARRAAVAEAGQRRTLRDHTYEKRIAELVELVAPLISSRRVA